MRYIDLIELLENVAIYNFLKPLTLLDLGDNGKFILQKINASTIYYENNQLGIKIQDCTF